MSSRPQRRDGKEQETSETNSCPGLCLTRLRQNGEQSGEISAFALSSAHDRPASVDLPRHQYLFKLLSSHPLLSTSRSQAVIYMGRLDHAITALGALGLVVQAVPVVGDGLKSATEVAIKICEVVKVRSLIFLLSMRSISLVENESKPRSLRGSCGSRRPATRSCRKRDLESQPGQAKRHGGKRGAAALVCPPPCHMRMSSDGAEQHTPGDQAGR
jgi:hypothetical protein